MLKCPYKFTPGHLVEPEDMIERQCEQHRFHAGEHHVVSLKLGRWWIWQHPGVRLRNFQGRVLQEYYRHKFMRL